MKFLRILHRWMALSAGLFIFLSAFSGLVLLYKNDLLQWTLSINASTSITSDVNSMAGFLQKLFEDDVEYIDFPKEETPYFVVSRVNRAPEFYHPGSLSILPDKYRLSEMITLLREYHTELLGGSVGGILVGFIGVAIFFLTLGGLILWYPGKQSFRIKNAIPRSIKRGHILLSHRTFGVIVAILFVVISVTGAGMVFSKQTKGIVNFVLGEKSTSLDRNQREPNGNVVKIDWNKALSDFRSVIPDGSITRLYALNKESPYLKFRFRLEGDWVPNGGSFAYVDSFSSNVAHVIYSNETDIGNRFIRNLYPIHAAYVGGAIYKFVVFCIGAGLIFMTVTGLYSWFLKTYKSMLVTKSHRGSL